MGGDQNWRARTCGSPGKKNAGDEGGTEKKRKTFKAASRGKDVCEVPHKEHKGKKEVVSPTGRAKIMSGEQKIGAENQLLEPRTVSSGKKTDNWVFNRESRS